MSKFNSSISTLGIIDPKVQQAILKLLENSLFLNRQLSQQIGSLKEQLRRQKVYFDAKIDELRNVK
jgi:hypothetical protein